MQASERPGGGSGRPLRLLHIFPAFSLGGQQRRLATLITGLGTGFFHRVVSLDGDLAGEDMLDPRSDGVTLEALVLVKSRIIHWKNVRRLAALIRAAEADLLCTYNFGSIEAVLANRIGPRLPHVHHEDGFGPDENENRQKSRRVLARRLLLKGSYVTTPSAKLARIALDVWKVDASRFRRIPVGVSSARFKPARRSSGPVVVGALGSLRPEKNFARLIRCFEKASEGRDARLIIYGDGPEAEKLRDLASASPARDRISLRGATKRPEEALAEFDIFALSSDTEQMPTSLIEAMAAGLPAVVTDVGDVRAMIGAAGRDFATPPSDERGFTARLRRLIDEEMLRERLGAEAALRAAAFPQDAMVAAFRSLYLEAGGGAG